MITFTIEKQASLKKTHFKDLEELRDFIDIELEANQDFDIDFRQLEKHEITPEIRKKAAEARKIPLSQLIRIPK